MPLISRLTIPQLLLLGCLLLLPRAGRCQGENVAPLGWNPALQRHSTTTSPAALSKQTAGSLSLPFFEDFSDPGPYPNSLYWTDSMVYVNNTMCVQPISRGVATFDALNAQGRPYDTVNRYVNRYADSLSSQPFDLSSTLPGDSVYLSFFYQPQGNGFSPESQDSLMLFFLAKYGRWTQVWSTPGADLQPFQQVMIPVTDTNYLHNGFRFRFVNKASINSNDDVWNLDYIRLSAGRSLFDTAVRDLAFTTPATNLLKDYSSMPYRQFLPNAAAELADSMQAIFWNHYATPATVNYGYTARETTTGTNLSSGSSSANVGPFTTQTCIFPTYTTTVTPSDSRARVVYRNTYFLQSGNPNEPKANDTLVQEQVFDNYLAYDDGSAEKSYFLNLASQLPGKTAIEFRLNQPDTLRGMAIMFGQQVPTAAQKFFSIVVYSKLGGIAGAATDEVLYTQEFVLPVFTDTIGQFSIYRFDTALALPAGVFYLGTMQPAASGSDSLYIGLDVNRVGGNHLYYNVLSRWESSNVSGALLIRPLLGGPVVGTSVQDARGVPAEIVCYPNPCRERLMVRSNARQPMSYCIADLQGRKLLEGSYTGEGIDMSKLSPGLYFVRLRVGNLWSKPQKIIKQ